MADTTYAVKVNDNVKEKLQRLVDESGLSSKDFFADMISQFELANARKQTPILAADIDELVKLTTRINNIFINVGERVSGLQETCRQDTESAIKEKESLIGLLQQQIEGLKKDIAETNIQMNEYIAENDRLNNEKGSLEKLYKIEINQLKEVNQKNNEIINGHNEKINTLSGLVNEYKGYSDENKILKKEVSEIQKQNEKFVQENEKLKVLVSEREKQIESMRVESELRMDELKQKHLNDIEYQKDKFELNRDKTLLEQREEYNKKLDEIRIVYNEKINQLLQVNSPKKEVKKKAEPKVNIQENQ